MLTNADIDTLIHQTNHFPLGTIGRINAMMDRDVTDATIMYARELAKARGATPGEVQRNVLKLAEGA